MQYRPHIDGLRAIAVLSVILFHLEIPFFDGGFVGVDVFFVLSGYLITNIIISALRQPTPNFKFSTFYLKRARRLLPALLVTLFLTLIAAVTLFSSERLHEFGSELVYAIASLSNFYFWGQSGYFDTAAEGKALLHMWSLSVEEQFYFIWPLTLVLAYRHMSENYLKITFAFIFLASLCLNIIVGNQEVNWVPNQSQAMFFLTPFRAYEFIIGAVGVWLVNVVPKNRAVHEVFFLISIAGLAWSISQFNRGIDFPYVYALLPCICTLILILAKESLFCKLILENRIAVFIGLISYSLYLVHWPVIVMLKQYRFAELQGLDIAISLALTFAITLCIYYGVEKPLRYKNNNFTPAVGLLPASKRPNKKFIYGAIITSGTAVIVGILLIFSSGLSSLKNELYSSEQINNGKVKRFSLLKTACKISDLGSQYCHSDRPLQVLVIGNSHEPDGYNMFHRLYGKNRKINLISFGSTNFCNISPSENGGIYSPVQKHDCDTRVEKLTSIDFIKSIDAIIFSSNRPFSPNKKGMWQLFKYFRSVNPSTDLLVLGSYINTARDCAEIANRFNSTDACLKPELISFQGINETKNIYDSSIIENIDFNYINKFKLMCKDPFVLSSCETKFETEPMFYDQHHLSLGFAQHMADKLSITYASELSQAGFK